MRHEGRDRFLAAEPAETCGGMGADERLGMFHQWKNCLREDASIFKGHVPEVFQVVDDRDDRPVAWQAGGAVVPVVP